MLTLDPVNALALEATANALIVNALKYGAPVFSTPPLSEVKAAHATVIAGASQVATAWAPILAPLNIEVASRAILIHGSPIVDFMDVITGKSERRELGDLLIVVDLIQAGNVVDRRATLTQAKLVTKTGHISLDPSGKAQRNLYLRWPVFTLPMGYKPHPRNLNDPSCPGVMADGCRFGGIDLHGAQRNWFQVPTAQRMNSRRKPSLGTSLMRMACGAAGRPAAAGGRDPWSELVDELMDVTFGVTYPAKRGQQRFWETMSFRALSPSINSHLLRSFAFFEDRGVPPGDVIGDDEASEPLGISIIHIELVKDADEGG
ncbi:hypothetical protein MHY87_15130 [Microvirga sp. ACRRW]|uniref:hypothetical protein n=1 Tax=Microvirga sp. ACRRW TaxID=2918205 RepID=UPI001EF457BF|nr:hypothetical protein [Microvirga sp. ACRRW]MCG7394238.1 hypothetical protein [Microvirga sp. ACRRW]